MNRLIKFTFVALVLTLAACKKDQATKAEISFALPQINDTIANYNQLHIEGTIEGDATLNGYQVKVVRASNDEELFTKTIDTKSKAYNFHEHWMNNVHDTTLANVIVTVFVNNDGVESKKNVPVVLLP